MKKVRLVSFAVMVVCLGANVSFAQTPIDGSEIPLFITTSGNYQVTVDSLIVNYAFAADSADSAIVDATRSSKSIIELNADNITLDGNNKVY